ncbi:MAG: histidinol dehydrogenase, partial [Nitrospirae bacterium]
VSDLEIESVVLDIIKNIRERGDEALIDYTLSFDKFKLHKDNIRVSSIEIEDALKKTDRDIIDALSLAADRIRNYHVRQKEESWQFEEDGITLGMLIRPMERIGVYVPGGKAAYPSSVLMNVIPAQVAGVGEIALCVPAPKGELNQYVLAAAGLIGVKEIYRVGGAQAVGAMAYGTESIKKVDKIVGPGNIYVATAKRLVYGVVDIDMIAGPSEILIIADDKAKKEFLAADMLSQAEHDSMASSILVTPSRRLAEDVEREVYKMMERLPRRTFISSSIEEWGAIIITKDLREAVDVANRIAPEHLEIMTEDPKSLLPFIKHAGAVFLGEWTPEPIGDYIAGPNHTLPTARTSRFFSPLGVYDFLKRTSLIALNEKGFRRLAPFVSILSDIEGLKAHGNTIKTRLDSIST